MLKNKSKFVLNSEELKKNLKDTKFAIAYLKAAIEESGSDAPELVLLALRRIAEVHGMAWLAKKTSIGRQALYQMLSSDGNPSIRNFLAIVESLGMRLCFESKNEGKEPGAYPLLGRKGRG